MIVRVPTISSILALSRDELTSDNRVFSSVTKLTFPLNTSVVCLFSPVKLRPLISGKYNALYHHQLLPVSGRDELTSSRISVFGAVHNFPPNAFLALL